jgi:murein DD-endopeptidase MepM/ murein hydrolase activator NlpD
VRQGDVIGYVGATGYATGPHLDYRVKRNGSWVNPRRLKLPAAAPVAEQDRPDFARINELLGRSLAALPDETTPTAVDGIETSAPPRWNASRYLAAMIPETLRPL